MICFPMPHIRNLLHAPQPILLYSLAQELRLQWCDFGCLYYHDRRGGYKKKTTEAARPL
jgi:hypothetical protein